MKKLDTTRTRLQNNAARVLKELEAILVLAGLVDRENRSEIIKEEKLIWTWNNRELREYIEQKTASIGALRMKWGVTSSRKELLELLQRIENAPSNESAFFRKPDIKGILPNYGRFHPDFDGLPEHAQIALSACKDVQGLDWWLPETRMYEDMCALFNLAKEQSMALNARSQSKVLVKRRDATMHATLCGAFYFVEAFLNGIAYDHSQNFGHQLNRKDKDLLSEDKHYVKFEVKVTCPRCSYQSELEKPAIVARV